MSSGVKLPPRCRTWPPRRAIHGGQAHVQAWACEALQDHREVAGACDTRTEPAMGEEPRTGVPAGECHKHLWIWERHAGPMVPILAVAFILIPLAELAVLIAVGDWIGLVPTLVLLLVVSVAGAWLAKREGLAAW